MTDRDCFAKDALAGILSTGDFARCVKESKKNGLTTVQAQVRSARIMSETAYVLADALIAASRKPSLL